MGTSKQYNLVPVKDNSMLFSPTPLFSGLGNLRVCLNLPTVTPCCHSNYAKGEHFALQPMETSKRHNSVPVKRNCMPFLPTLWCLLNLPHYDHCCHDNQPLAWFVLKCLRQRFLPIWRYSENSE